MVIRLELKSAYVNTEGPDLTAPIWAFSGHLETLIDTAISMSDTEGLDPA